ncbi:alpha/beta fold hydrolase [Streptomyces eurythermus]|uniref:alpha/beta fold hydrolase n=1 Tax=Streptomyces eurythermus TaxID=42237 RepID=UPI00340B7383
MTGTDLTRFWAAYDAVVDRWPVPVARIDLPSEHGTTRVLACGPADGEPLVLLHGGAATAAVWFANAAELSRTRRVYAVDRIGEPGGSVRGDRPPKTVAELLDWLGGVLDGLGLADRAVDLCGHSYGGWIALGYALAAPERVRRLVLLDPTQCFGGYRPGYLLRALPMLLRPSAAVARSFVTWETGGAPADPAWLELYGLAAEFPDAKPVVGRRPRPARVRGLRVPTLVALAAGSRAHQVRRVAAAARRDLAAGEVVVLPGVSHHGMPMVRAAELNALVVRFLARPSAAARG